MPGDDDDVASGGDGDDLFWCDKSGADSRSPDIAPGSRLES